MPHAQDCSFGDVLSIYIEQFATLGERSRVVSPLRVGLHPVFEAGLVEERFDQSVREDHVDSSDSGRGHAEIFFRGFTPFRGLVSTNQRFVDVVRFSDVLEQRRRTNVRSFATPLAALTLPSNS